MCEAIPWYDRAGVSKFERGRKEKRDTFLEVTARGSVSNHMTISW
jgi:hypothetical protein